MGRYTLASQWAYRCPVCSTVQKIRYAAPAERFREVDCTTCKVMTVHRLVDLPAKQRYADCPDWCEDHYAIVPGIEVHHRFLPTVQMWHTYLKRYEFLGVDIRQAYGPGITDDKRPQDLVPTISHNMQDKTPDECRQIIKALEKAIALIGGRRRSSSGLNVADPPPNVAPETHVLGAACWPQSDVMSQSQRPYIDPNEANRRIGAQVFRPTVYISTTEAGRRLGQCRATILALLYAGELDGYPQTAAISGRVHAWKVDEASIDAYVRRQKRKVHA